MAKPKYTFGVADFVNAVYQNVFGKNVPNNFLDDRENYIQLLEKGKISPEQFMENIFISTEIENKGLSNEEFLKLIFKAIDAKKVDPEDFEFWLSRFETRSRRGVLLGVMLTNYWTMFCEKYEVK